MPLFALAYRVGTRFSFLIYVPLAATRQGSHGFPCKAVQRRSIISFSRVRAPHGPLPKTRPESLRLVKPLKPGKTRGGYLLKINGQIVKTPESEDGPFVASSSRPVFHGRDCRPNPSATRPRRADEAQGGAV